MKFFNLVLFLIYFFHAPCSGEVLQGFHLSPCIQNQIERIPEEERLFLEKLFHKLIRSESLGYVLFGSKPISLSGYFIELPLGNILKGSDNFAVKQGWAIWKKHEHLFPHPNYLIFEEDHVRGDKDVHPIYFINKNNLLQTITNNVEAFRRELGADFNPETFLVEISKKQSISDLINFHDGLLGIMLGYGAESSMQYHKRELILREQPPFIYEAFNLQAVSQYPLYKNSIIPEDIQPIQFVGHPESQSVKSILEQNAKERAHLLDIYAQGRWLEITLTKLTE